ncbi:MAG: alpha/beta hydrolase [Solibacillus sp.]
MTQVFQRNAVTLLGKGEQTIVFAHGLGCNQDMWQYISSSFQNYQLVLFDHVGSGKSDLTAYHSEKYNALTGYAHDLIELLEHLHTSPVIFVGHSISSMIGMLAAIERPELFKSIIMIGPSPCYVNEEDYKGGFEQHEIHELLDLMEMNFAGWASYLAPLVIDYQQQPHVKDELEALFVSSNPRIAREFAEVTFFSDYRAQLHELTIPTLIIQCAEDSIVPVHVGQYMADRIPNNELIVMGARGHYPHISHPAATISHIKHFLKK